ncbi:MAG: ABC transporter substrate-binding protein [bacterium]|nr:ABC transporter substrate-binding protein [bacterium]
MKKYAIVIIISIFLLSCDQKSKVKLTQDIPLPHDPATSNCTVGKYGGTLVIASAGEPKTFNPIMCNESSSSDVISRMCEGLTTINNKTQKVTNQGLAKSWKVSKDGKCWTFNLRKGIYWSDGHPFTADDVIFTFKVIYDPKIHPATVDSLIVNGKKFKVEKIDNYTVKITTPTIYAPFLRVISLAIIPKHKFEKSYQEGNFESAYSVNTKPENMAWIGSFKLEKFLPAQKTVLVRNPYYFKIDKKRNRLPYLDRIVFVAVPDFNAVSMNFLAGETDLIDSIRSEDYAPIKAAEKKGNYTIYKINYGLGSSFLWFNLRTDKNPKTSKYYVNPIKSKWFTNVEFRQALSHAIDQKSIIDTIFLGMGYQRWGIDSPAAKIWYNPDIKKYPFSLKKSEQLLTKAGFIKKDNILYDSKGNRVEFTLFTNSENDVRIKIANLIKHDYQKLGVTMHINPVDFNSLVSKINDTFDYEACLLGLGGGDIDPVSHMNVLKSSGFTHLWWPKQKKPATLWEAEIDELMDKQLTTLEFKKRREIYNKVQEIIMNNCPMLYLPGRTLYLAAKNKIGNIKPTVLEHRLLWNQEELYFRDQ